VPRLDIRAATANLARLSYEEPSPFEGRHAELDTGL
jgi:hypothetical protein